MITVNGSAAINATDCNPSNPLLIIKTADIASINTPQFAFTRETFHTVIDKTSWLQLHTNTP